MPAQEPALWETIAGVAGWLLIAAAVLVLLESPFVEWVFGVVAAAVILILVATAALQVCRRGPSEHGPVESGSQQDEWH